MKRLLILLLCTLLCAPVFAYAETDIDLSGLDQAALLKLEAEVTTRLAMLDRGSGLYEEDGIAVSFVDMLRVHDNWIFGVICQNTTGKDYYMMVTGGAVNGINVGVGTNMHKEALPDGSGLFTGSYYNWLIGDLSALGSMHLTQVSVEISLYENDERGGDPVRVVRAAFPVDIDIDF